MIGISRSSTQRCHCQRSAATRTTNNLARVFHWSFDVAFRYVRTIVNQSVPAYGELDLRPRFISRAINRPMATLLLFASLLTGMANAATPEYQLKAVFLFNFTQFVEWPPDSFADPSSPLIIGVLGEDPFGSILDDIVRGETMNGRPLIVQRYRKVTDIKNCHVLFLSNSESQHIAQTLTSLKGHSILTVSDSDNNGFARNGGIIRLNTVDHKIHLRINLGAAQAARLTLSSKLLRPAEITNSDQD